MDAIRRPARSQKTLQAPPKVIAVRYLRSFDKSFLSLSRQDQLHAETAVCRLLDYFNGAPRPLGLGLRKLRDPFWEIRVSLDKRVLLTLDKAQATFVIIGNHDEIQRALYR